MKVGIIGGGQLAQMLALAGYPLGIKTICLEPNSTCPAELVTAVLQGEYADPIQLDNLTKAVDVLTYEFENVDLSALTSLTKNTAIYPPISALQISQDRWLEKNFFTELAIPTTRFMQVVSWDDLQNAIASLGLPAVIKTRRLGYDGKGQYVVRNNNDIEQAWQALLGQSLIVENFVNFVNELSLIAVRSVNGETKFYPLTENQHRTGILRVSIAPYLNEKLNHQAQSYLTKILDTLNYVGVLTVEFFQQDGQLIANEIAPRVHNSGHWTIEGTYISQFENHLRAILGLPLGATDAIAKTAMFNLIGNIPDLTAVLKIPEIHCHFYNKTPKPNRKLGHITLSTNDEALFKTRFKQLSKLILE